MNTERSCHRNFRSPWLIIRACAVLVVGSITHSQALWAQQSTASLAFEGVTVIDVRDGRLLPDHSVVITGNRIAAMGPKGRVRVPPGTQVVNARGKYLIPGLWDMHVHMRQEAPRFYPIFLTHGVTAVREMGQRFEGGADSFRLWRREVATGARLGPRTVGPAVDLSIKYYGRRDASFDLATPAAMRRTIDSLKAAGMVFLKYHDDYGDPERYFALLREARRVGLPFVGHVPGKVTEEEAADSGMRSIEHTNEHPRCWAALTQTIGIWDLQRQGSQRGVSDAPPVAPADPCGRAAAAYIRNGTWLTPTLVWNRYEPLNPQKSREWLRTMRRNGVTRFLAGSDTGPVNWQTKGIWPGVSLLEELMLLVEGGLTPLEALQAATLNPAKFFAATDSLGTVAPRKLADLVLLDADPLADIANVTKIQAVVANGRYFDRTALDAMDAEGVKRIRDFVGQRSPSAQPTSTAP